jgi:tetratricopeptide (TPR) repeat protein
VAWVARTAIQAARWGTRLAVLVAALLMLPSPAAPSLAPLIQRGDAAHTEGRFALALEAYQQAAAIIPNAPLLYDRLVTSSLAARRTDLALIYLEQWADHAGWTPALHRRAAHLYTAQYNPEAALRHWQASIHDVTDDRLAFREVITAALASRNWDAALASLERWLRLDPRDEWALYQAGLLLAPQNPRLAQDYLTLAAADPQYRGGAERLQRVFADYPNADAPTLALRLGIALVNLNQWSHAEHALTLALASAPTNLIAQAFLGLVRDESGGDGGPLVERALMLAPADPQVGYVAAIHWRLTGQPGRALDLLNRLGTQDPTNPTLAAELGTLQRAMGNLVRALEWYKVAVSLAPDEERYAVLLATFYAEEEINLPDEGVSALATLSQRFPDNADISACYGWALLRAGRLTEAQVHLERGLVLNSTSSRARYFYAIFQESRGDRQAAISSLLYVFQNATEPRYHALAIRALARLGYRPDPADLIGKFQE